MIYNKGFITKLKSNKMKEETLFAKQPQDIFGRVAPESKFGFVDSNDNWIIEPKFDWADDFNNYDKDCRNPRNAPVALNGKNGRIKPDGSYLIEPVFDKIWGFTEGFALVKLDGKWGYIKADGKYLVEPKYDVAMEFSKGEAYVKIGESKGFIDTEGKWVQKTK